MFDERLLRIRTPWIGTDLPVFTEGLAAGEDCYHCCDEGADDQAESDVDTNAIRSSKSVLEILAMNCEILDRQSYSETSVEVKHG